MSGNLELSGFHEDVAAAVREALALGWVATDQGRRVLLSAPSDGPTVSLPRSSQWNGSRLESLQRKVLRYADPELLAAREARVAADAAERKRREERRVEAREQASLVAADRVAEDVIAADLLARDPAAEIERSSVAFFDTPTYEQLLGASNVLDRIRELVFPDLVDAEGKWVARLEALRAEKDSEIDALQEQIAGLEGERDMAVFARDRAEAAVATVRAAFSVLDIGRAS